MEFHVYGVESRTFAKKGCVGVKRNNNIGHYFRTKWLWKGWSPYTNTFKYILVHIYVISNIILIATAKEIGQSQE
jgi:hypothetical protein